MLNAKESPEDKSKRGRYKSMVDLTFNEINNKINE